MGMVGGSTSGGGRLGVALHPGQAPLRRVNGKARGGRAARWVAAAAGAGGCAAAVEPTSQLAPQGFTPCSAQTLRFKFLVQCARPRDHTARAKSNAGKLTSDANCTEVLKSCAGGGTRTRLGSTTRRASTRNLVAA
eukprot:777947-Rhodomonas_salina.1